MKRIALLLTTLVSVSLAAITPSSLARTSTTAPGYNFKIDVYIAKSDVTLTRSSGRRGWLAHFTIHNQTKVAHVFSVGGIKSHSVRPGTTGKLGVYLSARGQFAFKVDKTTRGFFTVT
jgi:hypothetical protein